MNATVQAGVLAPGFSVSPLTLIVKFLAVNTKLPEMAILALKDLTAAKKVLFSYLSIRQSINLFTQVGPHDALLLTVQWHLVDITENP